MKKLLTILATAMISCAAFALDIPGWVVITDAGNNGSSTGEMTVATETIGGKSYNGVVTLKGKVTTKYQYGYCGMMVSNDAKDPVAKAFTDALKNGNGVKIALSGDGKKYCIRLETNDRPDYCFHCIELEAPKGKVVEYDIPYSKLKQYSWGAQKSFKKQNITALSIQTIGQPIDSYEVKVVSVKVF